MILLFAPLYWIIRQFSLHAKWPAPSLHCGAFSLRIFQKIAGGCSLNQSFCNKGEGILSVRMPEPSFEEYLSQRKVDFLHSLRKDAEFKTTDYTEFTAISSRQARRDLAELEKLGILTRHGRGPSTRYRLVRKPER